MLIMHTALLVCTPYLSIALRKLFLNLIYSSDAIGITHKPQCQNSCGQAEQTDRQTMHTHTHTAHAC